VDRRQSRLTVYGLRVCFRSFASFGPAIILVDAISQPPLPFPNTSPKHVINLSPSLRRKNVRRAAGDSGGVGRCGEDVGMAQSDHVAREGGRGASRHDLIEPRQYLLLPKSLVLRITHAVGTYMIREAERVLCCSIFPRADSLAGISSFYTGNILSPSASFVTQDPHSFWIHLYLLR